MYKHVSAPLHLFLLIVFLGTCASTIYFINTDSGGTTTTTVETFTPAESNQNVVAAAPAVVFTPTPLIEQSPFRDTQAMPGLLSTLNTAPGPGWSLVRPGLEQRVIPIYNGQNQQVESLHIWRLDQDYFRMDVAYDSAPKSLEAWQRETNALMVVNGGYYSIENERYFPDGLTIVNGEASGRTFRTGGMLAVRPDRAELRWLIQKPYDPSEPLQAALQSFPILVEPGGQLGFGPERENGANARRTVIAQDTNGRILFMVAPQGYFTLHRLSAYLAESDLDLDIAVNLDGGGSTGILVVDPHEVIPPTRPIPFVILVYPR
jgi:hypothetical protein